MVGSVLAAAAVLVPVGLAVGRTAVSATLGSSATPSGTGTTVDLLHLHGTALVVVARVVPLLLAGILALGASQRLGPDLRGAGPMVALVTASLALRLVFEVSLYGYYLMAACVGLIVLDIVLGRLRFPTIAWIVTASLLYPVTIGPRMLLGARSAWVLQLLLGLTAVALGIRPLAGRDGTRPLDSPSGIR